MVAIGVFIALALAACGLRGDDEQSDLAVTVVRGIDLAPKDMQRAEAPVARYLADSEVLVFVSSPLYSGSCTPTADAEMTDVGTVTLTISSADEGVCTADANRDTFVIQGFDDVPRHLIVEEQGQHDIELGVTD